MPKTEMLTLDDFDFRGKRVLLRVDINSPIDPETKRVTNTQRIEKSIQTIEYLNGAGAKLTIIAHQGDTEDYHKLTSLHEHAEKLQALLKKKVMFIDDVAGPAARQKIQSLRMGDMLLLDNLRYLCEEVSTFERDVKLTPEEMRGCYLVKNLAPLFDYYVNDAFAAAHRASPSMVAFQELLPSAAGKLLVKEVEALEAVLESPRRPCVFLLGGLRIADAFGMMRQALSSGAADYILTAGVTGQVMLMAEGVILGSPSESFIRDRSLDRFIDDAREYLSAYPGKVVVPIDIAVEAGGRRKEVEVSDLPADGLIVDIGERTVRRYGEIIGRAGTIFVNGPPGVYENEVSARGTGELWKAVSSAAGYSVIGGGDTITSASRFIDTDKIGYVCTAGGALIRFLSGVELPLLEAMKKAYTRWMKLSRRRMEHPQKLS